MALSSISLCAGVAGIDLGLRLADPTIRTVCYVEWAKFPAAVIAARIKDGCLDDAPIWDNCGTFDGRPWRGKVDLITAGFPCQPVSPAGKRLGMADERFIWGDVARIIDEVRPGRVFLENVPGIVSADDGRFLDVVLGSLVCLGFDCEWDLFSAAETGAPHRRERWFCLAYRHGGDSESSRSSQDQTRTTGTLVSGSNFPLANTGDGFVSQPGRGSQGRDGAGPAGAVLANPNGAGRQEQCGTVSVRPEQPPTEPPRRSMGNSQSSECQWPRTARPRWSGLANDGVYPPARNDYAGWSGIDASAQPAFRRDADGLAVGMDPSLVAYRNDRLRAVGNGVVPLTAAVAWIELNARIGR